MSSRGEPDSVEWMRQRWLKQDEPAAAAAAALPAPPEQAGTARRITGCRNTPDQGYGDPRSCDLAQIKRGELISGASQQHERGIHAVSLVTRRRVVAFARRLLSLLLRDRLRPIFLVSGRDIHAVS